MTYIVEFEENVYIMHGWSHNALSLSKDHNHTRMFVVKFKKLTNRFLEKEIPHQIHHTYNRCVL